MRATVSILLALHLLHLPVLCPDLDGECRGVPIEGLADAKAWHIILLGVRPNDDVDRGPIRPFGHDSDEPSQSPFGDHAAVTAAHVNGATVAGEMDLLPVCLAPELDPGRPRGNAIRLSWLAMPGDGPPTTQCDSVLRI